MRPTVGAVHPAQKSTYTPDSGRKVTGIASTVEERGQIVREGDRMIIGVCKMGSMCPHQSEGPVANRLRHW